VSTWRCTRELFKRNRLALKLASQSETTAPLDLSDEVSVLRGTFYGAIGAVVGTGLGFIANLLLARALGSYGYGAWSLGILVLSFSGMFASLGLRQGITRFVGLLRGGGETEKISSSVMASLLIVLLGSVAVSFAFFFSAPNIARFFHIEELERLLRILIWTTIPISVLGILVATIRGYEDIRFATLIEKFGKPLVWLSGIALLFGLQRVHLHELSWAYVGSNILILSIAWIFFARHKAGKLLFRYNPGFGLSAVQTAGPMLAFSLPLLLSSFLDFVKTQTDIFMLAYFLSATEVGIYNAASRIAQLSPFLLTAVVGIFMPIMAKNIAQGNRGHVQDLYQRVTKWEFVPTAAIIGLLFFFPQFFLSWFGSDYTRATLALRLLLITYLIHAVTGPNGAALIAYGRTKFVAMYTLLGAAVNVVLNLYLIPQFGVEGAAFASVVSVLSMNVVASVKLWTVYRITPFTVPYTMLVVIVAIGLLSAVVVDRCAATSVSMTLLLILAATFLTAVLVIRHFHLFDGTDVLLGHKLVEKAKSVITDNRQPRR